MVVLEELGEEPVAHRAPGLVHHLEMGEADEQAPGAGEGLGVVPGGELGELQGVVAGGVGEDRPLPGDRIGHHQDAGDRGHQGQDRQADPEGAQPTAALGGLGAMLHGGRCLRT